MENISVSLAGRGSNYKIPLDTAKTLSAARKAIEEAMPSTVTCLICPLGRTRIFRRRCQLDVTRET
jgi:hypothetical protein